MLLITCLPCVHIWFLRVKGFHIWGLTLLVRTEVVGKYMGDYGKVEVFRRRVLGRVNEAPRP